jgi:hypothetical protein
MIAAIIMIVVRCPNLRYLDLSTLPRDDIFITTNIKKLNQSFSSSSSLLSSLDEPPPTLMSTNSGLLRGELFPF